MIDPIISQADLKSGRNPGFCHPDCCEARTVILKIGEIVSDLIADMDNCRVINNQNLRRPENLGKKCECSGNGQWSRSMISPELRVTVPSAGLSCVCSESRQSSRFSAFSDRELPGREIFGEGKGWLGKQLDYRCGGLLKSLRQTVRFWVRY